MAKQKTILDVFLQEVTRYTSKWSHYFPIYQQYFSKFKNKNPVVVEIGIDNGGSIEGWKKYFGPKSTIIGIDIRPKITEIEGCEIVQGDQGNWVFWENFIAKYPKPDIVIDDGSHIMSHQILTFEKLFPYMKDKGIYLCEDTHTSYWNNNVGYPSGPWGGGYKEPESFIEYSKNFVDILHEDHVPPNSIDFAYLRAFLNHYERSIVGVHYYDSVVVVEKGIRQKGEVIYINRDKSY